MKKGLLFSGLIIAMTLMCCYALVFAGAADKKGVVTHPSLKAKAVTMEKAATLDQAAVEKAPVEKRNLDAMTLTAAKGPDRPIVATDSRAAALAKGAAEVNPRAEAISRLKEQGLYDEALWDAFYGPKTHREGYLDQGGDNCATATVFTDPLPYDVLGTTSGYVNDYDPGIILGCPYSGSTSPDVVYQYSPDADRTVDIDLCWDETIYDTKLYVYEDNCGDLGSIVACVDDACPGFVSQIIGLDIFTGHTYFIVIDGYGGDSGDYRIVVSEYVPPPSFCPPGSLVDQTPHMPEDGWSIATSDHGMVEDYLVAENFSGVTAPIRDVHWAGLNLHFDAGWYACTNEDPMTFEITFWEPGPTPTTIACQYQYAVIRTATGLLYAGFERYDYMAILDPPCLLTEGWVSIQGISVGTPDCWFLWHSSPIGNASSLQRQSGTWVETGFDRALCLTGEGELLGACCDPFTGVCMDEVNMPDCQPPLMFYAGMTCDELDPPCGMGACCNDETGECFVTSYTGCLEPGFTWHAGIDCDPNPCPQPCAVCPPDGTPEGEPICGDEYVDMYNGGCNSVPPVFSYINCGETVCGTSGTYLFGGSQYRDTDWFEVTLTENMTITWCVDADFPLQLLLIDPGSGNCIDYAVTASATGPACVPLCVTDDVYAGAYWLWVGPSVFTGAPCPRDWVGTLTCEPWEPPACYPDYYVTAPGVWEGNTCGAGDDCDLRAGEDEIFEITIPYASYWTVNLCEDTYYFDTFLYLTAECCGSVIASNDDGCAVNSLQSIIGICPEGIYLDAGTYYADVEAYSGCGVYHLTVAECVPPTGRCCIGDPFNPDCVDGVTEDECYQVHGGYRWDEGMQCPCPPSGAGDVCAAAFVIPAIPYYDSNNTCIFMNDYDEVCPYSGSLSPDVVYVYSPTEDQQVTVQVCENTYYYDTKLYIYEDDCVSPFYACNDDGCPVNGLQSIIECVWMYAGHDYYIVVDGYGSQCGIYNLQVTPCLPCLVECPADGYPEGEPFCEDEYNDMYNGGCNSDPFVFQDVQCGDIICATSGTFYFQGGAYRDTDWYQVVLETAGELTWCVVAEFNPLIFVIGAGSGNCVDYTILGSLTGQKCDTVCLTFNVEAGTYWLWAGPQVFGEGVPCGTEGGEYIGYVICEEACEVVNYCENPIFTGPGEGDPPTVTFTDTQNSCCGTDCVPCVWMQDCAGTCYTSGPDIVYRIVTTQVGNMTVTASGPGDNQVMMFTDVADPGGTCVGSADATFTGDDEVFTVNNLPAGTYYISMSMFGSTACGDITLHIASDVYLPVTLTSLEAVAGDREVALTWTTASEQNNAEFMVQRSTETSDWTTVGTVAGENNQTETTYNYTDRAVLNGVAYTYRLLSRDINGTVHEYDMTAEATPEAPVPTEYALEQNYPNPFNPNTSISYAVKEGGFVSLKVYNLLGQEVTTLVSQRMEIGRYTATFAANDLPSGIYVYRLVVNDFTAQKKMVLLK
jgi:hypothetical protein